MQGPVLGESYVLLPLHVAASGVLPSLGESAVGFGGADFFPSISSARNRKPEPRVEEQYFSAEKRLPPPAPTTPPVKSGGPSPRLSGGPSPRLSSASANAFRDKPTTLGDSVNAAAMAHAELSDHVQLITTHHAHWYYRRCEHGGDGGDSDADADEVLLY